jgi:hypothetical protein
MAPGQARGERGSFDHGDGRLVLLAGYAAGEDVFIFWDAGLYVDFAWSRNVQVKSATLAEACAMKIALQKRLLRRPSGPATETVVAGASSQLQDAILMRLKLTRERIIED